MEQARTFSDLPSWQQPILRWLFVDMDSFFASVEQQLDPTLRHRPVAVLPLLSEHTCVIAASYEAKALGIKTGTPVREAKRLCPRIIFRTGSFDRYVDYHNKVVEAVESCIPVTDICSIDEVACKLDPTQQNPSVAIALARQVQQAIQQQAGVCIGASAGIGPSRLLAKIGSGLEKPKGLVVLGPTPNEILARLGDLPLTKLPGIAKNMARRLALGQVASVADFYKLSPAHAQKLWGSVVGARFWYALQGYDILPEATQRSSVSHSQVLAFEMRTLPNARLVGRRLLQKAAARLRRMAYTAGALGVFVHTEAGEGWHKESLFDPTHSSFVFLRAFELLWHDLERDLGPKATAHKVGIWFSRLSPLTARQPDLFQPLSPTNAKQQDKEETLSAIIDSLNLKFGRDTVLVGQAPQKMAAYSGTKIAFTRIPTVEEFLS